MPLVASLASEAVLGDLRGIREGAPLACHPDTLAHIPFLSYMC